MKIRAGFVSNSSSSSFVLAVPDHFFKEWYEYEHENWKGDYDDETFDYSKMPMYKVKADFDARVAELGLKYKKGQKVGWSEGDEETYELDEDLFDYFIAGSDCEYLTSWDDRQPNWLRSPDSVLDDRGEESEEEMERLGYCELERLAIKLTRDGYRVQFRSIPHSGDGPHVAQNYAWERIDKILGKDLAMKFDDGIIISFGDDPREEKSGN
jgi:hypothetical protein